MELIYKYTGMIVFCLGALLSLTLVIYYLVKNIYDYLAKTFKPIWFTMEYVYRRKEFKEYMKNKKRAFKPK